MHHEGIGLEMQVSEHLVRAPAADEFDNIRVDLAAEKCHGTTGAEGAGGDVLR